MIVFNEANSDTGGVFHNRYYLRQISSCESVTEVDGPLSFSPTLVLQDKIFKFHDFVTYQEGTLGSFYTVRKTFMQTGQ